MLDRCPGDTAHIKLLHRAQGDPNAEGIDPGPLLLVQLIEGERREHIGGVDDFDASPSQSLPPQDDVRDAGLDGKR
jgi:hypothetical protein